jgi:predicted transcriptional regulator
MRYNKAVVMTTGNDKMVAVNVLVPREMRDALDEVAKARKWSLAVTVREALERLIDAEKPAEKLRKR